MRLSLCVCLSLCLSLSFSVCVCVIIQFRINCQLAQCMGFFIVCVVKQIATAIPEKQTVKIILK